jgi:hypothetical protein
MVLNKLCDEVKKLEPKATNKYFNTPIFSSVQIRVRKNGQAFFSTYLKCVLPV